MKKCNEEEISWTRFTGQERSSQHLFLALRRLAEGSRVFRKAPFPSSERSVSGLIRSAIVLLCASSTSISASVRWYCWLYLTFLEEFEPLLVPKKQGRPLSRAAVWWILETVPHRFCEVVHGGTVPSHIGDVVISSGSRSSGLRRIFASDQLEGGKIWKHFGVVKIALSLSLE